MLCVVMFRAVSDRRIRLSFVINLDIRRVVLILGTEFFLRICSQ